MGKDEKTLKLEQARELLKKREEGISYLFTNLKNLGCKVSYAKRIEYYDTAQSKGLENVLDIAKELFPDMDFSKSTKSEVSIPKIDVVSVKTEVEEQSKKEEVKPKKIVIQEQTNKVEVQQETPKIGKKLVNPFLQQKEEVVDKEAIEKDKKLETNLRSGYAELQKIAKGLITSPFNSIAIEQLKARITDWCKSYEKLLEFSQKGLSKPKEILMYIMEHDVPLMLEGAKQFESNMSNDPMNLDSINASQLLEGLKKFYKNTDKDKGEEYLSKLKQAPKKLTSFAEAATFLFSSDKEGIKEAEAFLLTKKIVTKYPANQLGTYYRGDNRPPKEIPNGFTAYKILTVKEAIEQAQKWFGEGHGPTTYHQDWISNKSGGDKIATGNDIGCMGYGCAGASGAARNVYMITVSNLQEMTMSEENLGVKPHAQQGPKLIINASKLADATIIGVKGKDADETTFFTSLTNVKLIFRFKGDDESDPRGWVWED